MSIILLLQEDCLTEATSPEQKATINMYIGDMFHQAIKVATEQ